MDKRKVVRDSLIIIAVIILILAVFYVNSGKGPVEEARLSNGMNAGHIHDGSGDMSAMTPMHGMIGTAITDGDPVVTLGERWIGSTWFEETVNIAGERLKSAEDLDADDETIDGIAKLESLFKGIEQIVLENAADVRGIEPDPEELAERERHFRDSIGTDEEIDAFLRAYGMTIENLRSKWSRESVEIQLMDKIIEDMGDNMPVGGVEQAVVEWLDEQMMSAPFTFHDPEIEALYREYTVQEMHGHNGPVEESVPEPEEI